MTLRDLLKFRAMLTGLIRSTLGLQRFRQVFMGKCRVRFSLQSTRQRQTLLNVGNGLCGASRFNQHLTDEVGHHDLSIEIAQLAGECEIGFEGLDRYIGVCFQVVQRAVQVIAIDRPPHA